MHKRMSAYSHVMLRVYLLLPLPPRLSFEAFGTFKFQEKDPLNLGIIFKTLRIPGRLGVCEHSSGLTNIYYEEFPYVKLKDVVVCGEAPVVAIDFLLIKVKDKSKKLIYKNKESKKCVKSSL